MTVTQYIGARYVPMFADPAEWDITRKYEPLTVVLYQGNSYTSRQAVPVGIDINNTDFWLETGNYNAQVEAYREEVRRFDGRITANTEAIAENATDIDGLQALFPIGSASIADGAIGSGKIANGAISESKIASGAVTHNKIAEGAISSINITDGAIGLVDLNDNVQSRIANNNVRYSNVVFIGDSYGRGVGGTDGQGWPYYAALALNIPTTRYINISNSGAGFIARGHSTEYSNMTFGDQLDYSVNHLPANVDASQVDLVVIGGGYNDHAQSGINAAVYNTVRKAQSLYPNAKVCFLPFCAGDRELTQEFNGAYHNMIIGAARAGAATCEDSLYWLYPYQLQTSYGDHIHPNGTGYAVLGRNTASFVMGGEIAPFTEVFGQSAEGFEFADGASSDGFRCGVNQGWAWMSGAIRRTGIGDLCTLPSYLRPIDTTYILAFAYADTDHHGAARIRVFSNGKMDFMGLESGEGASGLNWTIWLPFMAVVLGHEWQ